MKEFLALALILVLSALCGCSVPRAKPDGTAEPTEASASQPAAEAVTAAPGEKPYFQLAELPKIGSYYDGTVYKRMTEDYVETFVPSDKYGTVIPYIGDYRLYKDPESYGDMDFDGNYARYGLMTADGTVITDAVYDYVYTEDGFIIATKTLGNIDEWSDRCTILPDSGKWFVEIDDLMKGEGYQIEPCAKYQRLLVCTGEELIGYDYNGKKLFTTPKGYVHFQVIEETGRILLTDYQGETSIHKLLDMNGKELWSVESDYLAPGEKSSHYFIGSINEEQPDGDYTSYSGILDENGKWIVPLIYRNTQVYGDRFFVCDNGHKLEISDTDGNEITSLYGSGSDAPLIRWLDGELIYQTYDYETQNRLWYSVNDDEPIMPKGVEVVDVTDIEDTDLFFGIDEGGMGYLYTRDGTVKKVFEQGLSCSSYYGSDMIEIITGSEQKKTTHMIDPGTMKEVSSYVSYDEANDRDVTVGYMPNGAQRYLIMHVSSIKDEEADWLMQVFDCEAGKAVLEECDTAELFVVNGKTCYCAIKDNLSVVVDQDGRTLLRMPCSYVD